MSDSLGIHLTSSTTELSAVVNSSDAPSTDTKLHDAAQLAFNETKASSTTSISDPVQKTATLSNSSGPIQTMAAKADNLAESRSLKRKIIDTLSEIAERSGAVLDAVSTAGAADASGAFSFVSCLLSVVLAIRISVSKLMPAKAQLRSLDKAIKIIQKAIDTGQDLDIKDLNSLLPKNLQSNFDDPAALLKEVKQARQELLQQINTQKANISMHLLRSALAGIDALVKFLNFAAVALKVLGSLTGILVIVNAIIKCVKHGKAIHSINKELKELKNELATCPRDNKAKVEELQQKISQLTLERKSHIFQMALGLVELAIGLAITVVHATTGGLALPILAGILGACAIAGLVGDACFARKAQASAHKITADAKALSPPSTDQNTSAKLSDAIAARVQSTQNQIQHYLEPTHSTPLLNANQPELS